MATPTQVSAWIEQAEADLVAAKVDHAGLGACHRRYWIQQCYSYRYPFLVEGEYKAPVSYQDWDAYQGNAQGAQAAVARLLGAVKEELKLFKRRPK
jgi:hypothetical protein